ncbi:MAG: substrate-binding domain-containing protein, partial [Chloroflexota bacterium]
GGFIVLPSYFGIDAELRQTLKTISEEKVPVAFVGESGDQGLADNITYDSRSSANQAVDYLISLGHERIGYIGYGSASGVTDTRLIGYFESHRKHNLEPALHHIEEVDITPEAAYGAMDRLFNKPNPPTAILAINDVVALGILDYCADHGLSIPADLSLITYDYQTLTRSVTSNITSIVISGTEAGETLANLIIQRQQNTSAPPQHVHIESRLEIRASTA